VFIFGIFFIISYCWNTERCVCVCVCVCAHVCFVLFCFMSETNVMWTLSHLFSLEIGLVSDGIQGVINAN